MSFSFLIVLPKEMRSGERRRRATARSRRRKPCRSTAELRQELQHLRFGIGLHGVEDARVRQRLCEGVVIVPHDVEVDDEAGSIVTSGFASRPEEFQDLVGHRRLPYEGARSPAPYRISFVAATWPRPARWKRGSGG